MPLPLDKQTLRRIWRAIIEFDLIAPRDRILVGLSGGKDSSFLTYALKVVAEHAPFPVEVAACTVDLGFETPIDPRPLQAFTGAIGVEFHLIPTQIAKIAMAPGRQNPCSRCAYHRRGAMAALAREKGYNKIALAHHLDDAVETFLMSQIYSGQIQTFLPKTVLDGELEVIRPLVYLREGEVRRARRFLPDYTPIPSPCPLDGGTKRTEVKELIHQLSRENRQVFANLVNAMRRQGGELWPPPLSRQEMAQRHHNLFWTNEPG